MGIQILSVKCAESIIIIIIIMHYVGEIFNINKILQKVTLTYVIYKIYILYT